MIPRKRLDVFYEYCALTDTLVKTHNISPIAHGWKKTKIILWIYVHLCGSPLARVRRLRSYLMGVDTWDNFKSLYYPVLFISMALTGIMILLRLAMPAVFVLCKFPHPTLAECSEIVVVSGIWLLLIYVVEHEISVALSESDIFRLVNKLKSQYSELSG